MRAALASIAPVWRLWCVTYYELRIACTRDPLSRHMPRLVQRASHHRSLS